MGKDIKHEIFSNLFKGAEKFWNSTSTTTTSNKVEIKYTFKPLTKEV